MRRFTSLLLAVLMVVTMVSASLLSVLAAESTVLSVDAPAEVGYTGDAKADAFQVPFTLKLADGLTAIAGYRVTVTWNPELLSWEGIEFKGAGLTDVKVEDGTATLAAVNPTDVLSGELFVVTFAPLTEGEATISAEVDTMNSFAVASGLIEAYGSSSTVVMKNPVVIYETPEEIVNAAYGLADGETLSDGHLYTLTGVITSVNDAYSSQYGNVTVTIQIGDMTDKLIKCYRMKGNGADVIKTGDTITVTGVLKNYKGTIEFDAGCTLDSYVPGEEEVVIYKTPEEIVNALYELEAGETLSDGYVYELTGVIVEVNEPYNEAYGNIGVTIQIGDMADKLIYCYRLKGEGADLIDVGDTITVKGSLKNYNGTREFVSCSILSYELKEEEPVENTKVDVDVNKETLLTDGKTGFTGDWGEIDTGDVVLVANGNCTAAGMDVTLTYALDEAKKINGVTVDLYHCANVMIGYPEGQATVEISLDGKEWKEIGKFDLAEADVAVGKFGTVSNVFTFEEVEAAYVRVLLYAGASTSVLGNNPANGKIFWEFISVAEFAVSEAPVEPPVEIYETPEEIVNAAYGLADGETLSDGHLYTLTGVITSVNDAYSSQYGNVTVTIQIGDMTDKLIKCYRMKGNGADVIKTGDTITVTGVLKNYKGTIEFDAGCTLDSYVPGEEEVVIYKTPEEIVNALYELEAGETLSDGYVYELTGVIVEVNEPYNEAYGNIGVTIQIGDMADKLIYCYRLKGEGADLIDVGDTITVKGSLKNYNGTREFVSCSILSYELKPEFARGDVDGNGKVNALDYAKLKAHCMRLRTLSEEELSRSDLNGDNRVNVLDYGVLKKLVMNKKSS